MTTTYRSGLFELQPNQRRLLIKILGTAAIATAPGRGYRFTLELVAVGESSSPPLAKRHNLPPQLTSFIGHEEDIEECAALLDHTRLLTLTGIGGCGKSRFAIQLAERVLRTFPDGVWYVDLAPLLDAERVALTVATALGVREEKERPIVDTLCERLAHQHTLLVLDNCEHKVVSACAALVMAFARSRPTGCKVLATSREAMGVPGEQTVRVRSLSCLHPLIKSETGLVRNVRGRAIVRRPRAGVSCNRTSRYDAAADRLSPRSAGGSTAFRWPSNSPQPA